MIVLDPGHGGIDPGAIGVDGVREKDDHAGGGHASCAGRCERSGRYQVVLTRDSDEFVPLRDRISEGPRGRAARCSSRSTPTAMGRHGMRGASVYTLSEKASDREAAKLAAKENKADIIAGIDLGQHDAVVTSILIDLAQRDTKNQSIGFADVLVGRAGGGLAPAAQAHRRFAGFAVLKAPDMPSVLVELGYLSNPTRCRATSPAVPIVPRLARCRSVQAPLTGTSRAADHA